MIFIKGANERTIKLLVIDISCNQLALVPGSCYSLYLTYLGTGDMAITACIILVLQACLLLPGRESLEALSVQYYLKDGLTVPTLVYDILS